MQTFLIVPCYISVLTSKLYIMKQLFIYLNLVALLMLGACDSLVPEPEDQVSELKSAKKVLNFRAHLSGENSMATGEAIFQLNTMDMMLSYKLIVADLENVIMAHIHLATEPGQSGPPAVWLYPSTPPPTLIEGTTNGILKEGMVEIDQDFVDAMYEGRTYVNVHTTAYPGGEIKGWIEGNMPKGMH